MIKQHHHHFNPVKKGNLICFIGIDGSGKTTQAKALVDTMHKNGLKSRYVYGRLEPVLLKPFITIAKIVFFRGKDMFEDYHDYSDTKKKLFKNSILFTLFKNLLLLDNFLQNVFKIKIPLMSGTNIVCDRYVYDTIISDLAVDSSYSYERLKSLLEKCLYVLPKPNLVFLIDIPEEIAYKRKDDTPSIDFLKERRMIYLNIGKEYGMTVLDGTKDLEELKNVIETKVSEFCKGDKTLTVGR